MKRLARIFHASIIGLSLFLVIATAASWIRSHSISDRLAFRRYTRLDDGAVLERIWAVRFSRGRLHSTFARMRFEGMSSIPRSFSWSDRAPSYRDDHDWVRWSMLGFQYKRQQIPDPLDAWTLAIPHWFVFVVFSIPSGVILIKRIRRACRIAARQCPTCGYDLRGSPGPCSECGNPVSPAPLPHSPSPL